MEILTKDSIDSLIYNGLSDPKKFVERFTLQSALLGWDETAQIAKIPFFLKGKAKRVYTDLATKTTTKHVFDALLKDCQLQQDNLCYQFYNRKRRNNESVSSYAHALMDLLLEAFPTMIKEHQMTLLRSQLCLSVDEATRCLIQFSSSFGTDSWEKLLGSLDRSSITEAHYADDTLIKKEPLEANWLDRRTSNNTNQNFRSNNSNNATKQTRFQGECAHCFTYGHSMDECRKLKAILVQQQAESKPRNGNANANRGRPNRTNNNHTRNNNYNNSPDGPPYNNPSSNNFSRNANMNSTMLNDSKMSQASNNQTFDEFNDSFLQDDSSASNSNTSNKSKNNQGFGLFATDLILEDEHTMEVSEASVLTTVTPMLKTDISIDINGNGAVIKRIAFWDGGSSNSFISPEVLSDQQLTFLKKKAKQAYYTIRGATGQIDKAKCLITSLNIKIGDWSGEHVFVITNAVKTYNVVLGRDFFKQNKVIINHENDQISISGTIVQVNHLSTTDSITERILSEIADIRKSLRERQITLDSSPNDSTHGDGAHTH